jgi:hypothetical protein
MAGLAKSFYLEQFLLKKEIFEKLALCFGGPDEKSGSRGGRKL